MRFDLRPFIVLFNRRRSRKDPAFRKFYARWLVLYFGFFLALAIFPDAWALIGTGIVLIWILSRTP